MSEFNKLTGVGPKRRKVLEAAGILTLRDLIYHLPRKYLDRTKLKRIDELRVGEDALFTGEVVRVEEAYNRLTVYVRDDSGMIPLVYFNGVQFLRKKFAEGRVLAIAGTPGFFREDLQLVHPETDPVQPGEVVKGYVLPRYPLTEEMAAAHVEHKFLQRIILEALENFTFSDPIPEELHEALNLVPEIDLLRELHAPESLENHAELRRQLKCRELFPFSLRLERRRFDRLKVGRTWKPDAALTAKLMAALPFELTGGQRQVIAELSASLEKPHQIQGLLQGDVGSGKTVVCLLGAASVLAGGGQVVLMAPTEILAVQHRQTLEPFLRSSGITFALLIGDTPREERETMLRNLQEGKLQFLIGTHAVFSPDVSYTRLGLVIIDEQHRFGVEQRAKLMQKGDFPDVLYMSATPIPRTLAHTVYGDLEMFLLKEKPKYRLPIKTRIVPPAKRADMLNFLLKEVREGNQVFWVVPQIGARETRNEDEGDAAVAFSSKEDVWNPNLLDKEEEDLLSVERLVKEVASFSTQWKVGYVHGRLSSTDKESALADFRAGRLQVLVATTVIEVGIDVPQANLIIIEHGDRFGLAQLHQLRGRTGRGAQQAWCFLPEPEKPWPPETAERLQRFCETEDGFAIAEMDFEFRGAGNLTGSNQSGFDGLRFTDLRSDFPLIQSVRELAREVLEGRKVVSSETLNRFALN